MRNHANRKGIFLGARFFWPAGDGGLIEIEGEKKAWLSPGFLGTTYKIPGSLFPVASYHTTSRSITRKKRPTQHVTFA